MIPFAAFTGTDHMRFIGLDNPQQLDLNPHLTQGASSPQIIPPNGNWIGSAIFAGLL